MNIIRDSEATAHKIVIGRRFAMLRGDLQLSQAELAHLMGVSQNLIFRLEKEIAVSNESLIYVFLFFVKNYKVNPEWLFAPNNQDVPRYHTELKLAHRKNATDTSKRREIINRLLDDLRELDQVTNETQNS